MAKSILLLTDFSHDSYGALYYTTQLFKSEECNFHILHTYNHQSFFYEDYPGQKSGKPLSQFLYDSTVECLEQTYHKIILDTARNTLHTFTTLAEKGDLEKVVKDYVLRAPIDLVVMGNKGKTGAKEIFMGGNTIRIVKSDLPCPILCVPKEIDYRPISQIAYVTDFKHPIKADALGVFRFLGEIHQASLHLLHINSGDKLDSEKEKNKEFLVLEKL